MNKEQIMAWARESGFEIDCCSLEWHDRIERFAALVAAHVRETEFKPDWNNYRQGVADGAAAEREACLNEIKPNATPMEIAAAIRARGKA